MPRTERYRALYVLKYLWDYTGCKIHPAGADGGACRENSGTCECRAGGQAQKKSVCEQAEVRRQKHVEYGGLAEYGDQ